MFNKLVIVFIVILVLIVLYYLTTKGFLPRSNPVLGAVTGAPGLRFGSVKDDSYNTLWTPGNRQSRSDTFNIRPDSGITTRGDSEYDAKRESDTAYMESLLKGTR